MHVVFGFICKNIEFLDKLKEAETEGEKPVQTIKIVDCGEVLKKWIFFNINVHLYLYK